MKKFDRLDLKETAKIYIQDNKYVRKLFFPVLLANIIICLLTSLLAGQMFRSMLSGSMFGTVRVPPILMSLVTFNPLGILVSLFTFSISLKILDVMKNKTEEEHNDKTIKELLPDILFGFQKKYLLPMIIGVVSIFVVVALFFIIGGFVQGIFTGFGSIASLSSLRYSQNYSSIFASMFATSILALIINVVVILLALNTYYGLTQTLFILKDNIDLNERYSSSAYAIDQSLKYTKGLRWHYFVLQFSFLLWRMVENMLFGIFRIYSTPYMSVTYILFYLHMVDLATDEDVIDYLEPYTEEKKERRRYKAMKKSKLIKEPVEQDPRLAEFEKKYPKKKPKQE